MTGTISIAIFMLTVSATNYRQFKTIKSPTTSDGRAEPHQVPEPLNYPYKGARDHQQHLILTPYVKNNRLKEGVLAAIVRPPLLNNVKSYSGFFEVDEPKKSYMFFLLFRCIRKLEIRRRDIPVIVWLQGGTGSSSMYGAFRGNGPIRIENDGKLAYNNYSWAEKAHLVYFDNPVGAGYSYTLKQGFSKNVREAAENLYTALKQFLALFRLAKNPLYIASQGFGGKYVTSLGVKIHEERRLNKIKLEGVVIGNGFIDPPNMLQYGALMYQLGFFDGGVRNKFGAVARKITSHLRNGSHEDALELYEQWVIGNYDKRIAPRITQISGLHSTANYQVDPKGRDGKKILNSFFNKHYVKTALHSGVGFTLRNARCTQAMRSDTLKSEVQHLRILMNEYRVLLYHGQMSIINAYPLMLNYLNKIHWHGKNQYNKNNRSQWRVDGEVAGYYKNSDRFTELLMRNAGVMVMKDQPKWAQRMINNFVHGLALNTNQN